MLCTYSSSVSALMSGNNYQMVPVTTVASGLDGSDASLSPYKWTAPKVTPYSAIYFFQVRICGVSSCRPVLINPRSLRMAMIRLIQHGRRVSLYLDICFPSSYASDLIIF